MAALVTNDRTKPSSQAQSDAPPPLSPKSLLLLRRPSFLQGAMLQELNTTFSYCAADDSRISTPPTRYGRPATLPNGDLASSSEGCDLLQCFEAEARKKTAAMRQSIDSVPSEDGGADSSIGSEETLPGDLSLFQGEAEERTLRDKDEDDRPTKLVCRCF